MSIYRKSEIPSHLLEFFEPAEIGLESTPDEYVEKMVEVFSLVRELLADDGVLFLNLGDSYASNCSAGNKVFGNPVFNENRPSIAETKTAAKRVPQGLKPKDLIGIPWRVAFALQQPRYTGRIKNEIDRVWLAAMIDGEGCFYVHKRTLRGCLRKVRLSAGLCVKR